MLRRGLPLPAKDREQHTLPDIPWPRWPQLAPIPPRSSWSPSFPLTQPFRIRERRGAGAALCGQLAQQSCQDRSAHGGLAQLGHTPALALKQFPHQDPASSLSGIWLAPRRPLASRALSDAELDRTGMGSGQGTSPTVGELGPPVPRCERDPLSCPLRDECEGPVGPRHPWMPRCESAVRTRRPCVLGAR